MKDYVKRLKAVDDAIQRQERREKTIKKTQSAYKTANKLKYMVTIEIEQHGLTTAQAVDKVFENKNILRIYPELRDEGIRRKIKNNMRNEIYNKYRKKGNRGF